MSELSSLVPLHPQASEGPCGVGKNFPHPSPAQPEESGVSRLQPVIFNGKHPTPGCGSIITLTFQGSMALDSLHTVSSCQASSGLQQGECPLVDRPPPLGPTCSGKPATLRLLGACSPYAPRWASVSPPIQRGGVLDQGSSGTRQVTEGREAGWCHIGSGRSRPG